MTMPPFFMSFVDFYEKIRADKRILTSEGEILHIQKTFPKSLQAGFCEVCENNMKKIRIFAQKNDKI